jgi:cobalt-zinc-cadmium efflux system membrane fusion protein
MNRLILLLFVVLLAACQDNDNTVNEPVNPPHGHTWQNRKRLRGRHKPVEAKSIYTIGDTVFVPFSSPVMTKLKFKTVTADDHTGYFTTTGVVRPISGHKAEVASPFEGRIVRSFINLGQKVSMGSPLFEVSSSDYLEHVRMFMQAKKEKELAEKNLARKKDLMEKGVSSRREYDEARLEFDLADKELEKTASILKIMNLNPDDADLIKPMVVRSPIAGEVVNTQLTAGQFIRSDEDPLVIVADINKIWVVANVKEKDLGAFNLNNQVEVFTESMPDNPIKGQVSYIGDIMNQETRSVEVYIECQNPDHVLKCGMFVTVRFYHSIPNSIVIPASSVLQNHDKSYLFVQARPGVFVRKRVEVTSFDEKDLIVNSGLEHGKIIVSEGGLFLQ